MSRRRQNGFTLIELMVALLIGLFLLGGMTLMVQDNRRAFASQNSMAQLLDSERMAMTMVTDIIQSTGYFPNPRTTIAANAMPAFATYSMAAGQPIYGTGNGGLPGTDTIVARYQTNSGDGILNCSGVANGSGGAQQYINRFYVQVNAGVSQLMCDLTVGGVTTPYPLVNNVKGISIQYGVNSAGSGNNVDSYMTATQVSANGDWNNVISALVTLTFVNPITGAGIGTQPATISFQRTASLMYKVGI